MEKGHYSIQVILSLLIGVVALFASLKGIFDTSIYIEIMESGMIPSEMVWGSEAQDIVSAVIGVVLIILSVFSIREQSLIKSQILIGCAWYFFYAFGLYVMQGAYTSIYPVYLVIFGLSIYAMILGLIGFNKSEFENIKLSKNLKIGICIFLLLIVMFLTPAWTGQMLMDIAKRQPGSTYAVYIMDLAIVFPAMIITVYLLLKKHNFGMIMAGICLVKTFTLCLSWSFAEWTQCVVGNPVNIPMAVISLVLCVVALTLLIVYTNELNSKSIKEVKV